MYKSFIALFVCAIACTTFSCKKEQGNTQPNLINKIKIGESILTNNSKLTLYSDKDITTGFFKVYASLVNSGGDNIKNAVITYSTLMQMDMMAHASPVEQPVFSNEEKMYIGAVVFSMPSSPMNTWVVKVSVNGEEKIFPINVPASTTKNTGSYTGTDGKAYLVTIVPPQKWQVGLNDFEILINQRLDMMHFPVVENLQVSLTTEMPSMGHSSPNNINPVSIGNGHYKGKANFTMTGDWRLHFQIKSNDVVLINDAYVDILF
ncbi:MAG: FixH family protein [Bacteroidetes bacterium]|nr:FixH family protein [Bacteroidota bacterium]